MKLFDRKFGEDFLKQVPTEPGVYRLLDDGDRVVYIGKAKNLRRRLSQYRNPTRRKKDRKKRKIIRDAVRIEWEVCPSELDAELAEVRLIQKFRPRHNVVGAYSFLYPYLGVACRGREVFFCFTTLPEKATNFELFGAFRAREVTAEAFFSLMRLLRYVGHCLPRHQSDAFTKAPRTYVFGFRRLPEDWSLLWKEFFRGLRPTALEELSLRLLDNAGARAASSEVQEDLRAIHGFWEREAILLADAIARTGYCSYPVEQTERDPLFLRYRELK